MLERLRQTLGEPRISGAVAASVLLLMAGVGVTGASQARDEKSRTPPDTVTIDAKYRGKVTIRAAYDENGQFGGIQGEIIKTHPACDFQRVVRLHSRYGDSWALNSGGWYVNARSVGTYRAHIAPEINFYRDGKEGRQAILCKGASSRPFEVSEGT